MGYNPTKTMTPRLGHISSKISRKVLGQQGAVLGQIFHDWEKIVGPHITRFAQIQDMTFPYKQKIGGTLHVMVASGSGPVVQHLEGAIIERCNSYFGYKALSRMRIHQGGFQAQSMDAIPREPEETLMDADRTWLDETTQGIESDELKETLRRFGESLLKAHTEEEKSN